MRDLTVRRILSAMNQAFIVLPAEGRHLNLGNFSVDVLATSAQTSGEFTLVQTRGEPPGFGAPLHRHRDAAEAFFVLEGEYLMFIEDQQTFCPPGHSCTCRKPLRTRSKWFPTVPARS